VLQSQPVLERLAELKDTRGWRMGLSVSGKLHHVVPLTITSLFLPTRRNRDDNSVLQNLAK
jgi:hypothetical protein